MNQEDIVDGNDPGMLDFERLLDEYRYTAPKRGQILEGEIVSIQEDAVLLDVGLKRAALVPPREMRSLSAEILDNLSVGDVVPVHVVRTPVGDDNLLVSIEKVMEYRNWLEAEKLLNQEESVELSVTGENRGGLLVQFDQLEGFVPNSHVPGLKKIRDHERLREAKQQLIGSYLQVKPIEVDRARQRLVFSASAAQEEQRQQRLRELGVGDVIRGTVVNLVDFGAFVDLGGIDGLVHISELDWHRVKHPSEVVSVGDAIDIQVLEVDVERERISLSRKALIPSPWEAVAKNYEPGDLIEVRVASVARFGAFAELPEGVEGLIHNHELGYSRSAESQRVLEPGEVILVRILKIDPERKRIALSMRQVPEERQVDWIMGQFDEQETQSDRELHE